MAHVLLERDVVAANVGETVVERMYVGEQEVWVFYNPPNPAEWQIFYLADVDYVEGS